MTGSQAQIIRQQLEDLAHHIDLERSKKVGQPMDLRQIQVAITDLYTFVAEVARISAKG